MDHHIPVLINQIIAHLNVQDFAKGFTIVDACFGEGGYARKILDSFPQAKIIGIEQDKDVYQKAKENFKGLENSIHLYNDNFIKIPEIIQKENFNFIQYFIFDLGISMFHIRESGKGITFLKDQPLDMRLSPYCKYSAEEVINTFDEKSLADIFYLYGEEHRSFKVARSIINARQKAKIITTAQLEEVIFRALGRKGNISPSTKIFQALRIFINNELDNLKSALMSALNRTIIKGRVFTVTYHSLEDRIVKNMFREYEARNEFRNIVKKPLIADEKEIKNNRSARSAKLRIAEKIKFPEGIYSEEF